MIWGAALLKLLEFATKKSHFLFADQYYNQIDGVSMGSPLGQVLANIFMCHFEERWVTKGQIRLPLWYRYGDDTFTMFVSKDTANEFLRYLNSRHESIKFTTDFEQDNEIPFFRHPHQMLPKQHFKHIHLTEKDVYWPLYKMGFLHSTQVQNKSYFYTYLSLLPNLLLCFPA